MKQRETGRRQRILPLEPVYENQPPIGTERDAVFALRDALTEILPSEFDIRMEPRLPNTKFQPDLLISPREGTLDPLHHYLAVEVKSNPDRFRFFRGRQSRRNTYMDELTLGPTTVPIHFFDIEDVTHHLDRVLNEITGALGIEAER